MVSLQSEVALKTFDELKQEKLMNPPWTRSKKKDKIGRDFLDRLQALSHVRKLFTLKAVLRAKFLFLDKNQIFSYQRCAAESTWSWGRVRRSYTPAEPEHFQVVTTELNIHLAATAVLNIIPVYCNCKACLIASDVFF